MKINTQPSVFMAANADFDAARFCLLGAPLDITVSFRPGTRRGPEAIRQLSWALEEYSLYQRRDLAAVPFADLGDLALGSGALEPSLAAIEAAVGGLAAAGKVPVLLGGEHLISWPAIGALAQVYGPELTVLHFDAHADLRDHYEGQRLSHATVMRRVAERLAPLSLYQFGIRSATEDEMAFAAANTHLYPFQVLEPLGSLVPSLAGKPIYVSLDIDVFDPALAPGVGTPEPGGQNVADMLQAVMLLAGLNIVGADIVEVCPPFDQTERTAVLAALMVRELLLAFHG